MSRITSVLSLWKAGTNGKNPTRKRGTLKGQHLFVRPAEPRDETALLGFFGNDSAPPPETLVGPVALVAKLAGTIVAHVGGAVEGDAVFIRSFYVARDLRRKRIGRGLLRRLEELAAGMQCSRLVAAAESPCDRFFEHAGFARNGGVFIREIQAHPHRAAAG